MLSPQEKKIKNLTALLVILSGLLVASLIVDFGQLITQSGFSSRALKNTNVIETAGKTWVAYTEPKVSVKLINDPECAECDPTETLLWLRRALPTIEVETIDAKSETGKVLLQKLQSESLPTYVFSEEVTQTLFYAQAESLFAQTENWYTLNLLRLGVAPGKFFHTPGITEEEVVSGPKDAKLKIIEYVDFECPYCRAFHSTLDEVLKEHAEVGLVYKHLPLASIHEQANAAAKAVVCATKQEKGYEMGALLFQTQEQWGFTKTAFLPEARVVGLDQKTFTSCQEDPATQAKIDADTQGAQVYGITGTPGIFVGERFFPGVVDKETLLHAIESQK